jgi:hypothetical protein
MTGLFMKLSFNIFVIIILGVSSLPIEAAETNKRVTNSGVKDQRITVTAIQSNNNGCGNRMGAFDAAYRGKTVGIVFTHGKVRVYQKGSSVPPENILCKTSGEKLSFLNRPIDIIGNWSGKDDLGVDQFKAKKIFIK